MFFGKQLLTVGIKNNAIDMRRKIYSSMTHDGIKDFFGNADENV